MNKDFISLRNRLVPIYGEREARAVAQLVFDEAFGVSMTDIYADKVKTFSQAERQRFEDICSSLASGVPVQYVLGYSWFNGHRFSVAPGVLIPRPETEELVEWAVQKGSPTRILDAGTGSGCIAISLKLALPEAEVEAWDFSAEALQIAQANASDLQAEVTFKLRDMLEPWTDVEPFDMIVSNPPYVCEKERADIEAHVLDYEPETALFVPDSDPLRFYRALAISAAEGALKSGGWLMVEANCAYAQQTAQLFEECGLVHAEVRCDVFGRERMVAASRL